MGLATELAVAVAAAREVGALLRAELHRLGGPRVRGARAEIEDEAEAIVRGRLAAATPYSFLGEAAGFVAGADADHVWLVDVNDGRRAYLKGHRGTAATIALLRRGEPVLGVVYAFASPDDRGDLVAWAEGEGPVTRDGVPVTTRLEARALDRASVVLVSPLADENPSEAASCVAPARFVATPSIAHRLALVASGRAAAAASMSSPLSVDFAAGHALLRGAGGDFVDHRGEPVRYGPKGEGFVRMGFGGPREVVAELARRPWRTLVERTRPVLRASLYGAAVPVPGRVVADSRRLSRAQGCLLGQLAGDALGQLVEFDARADIAARHPRGVRDLVDGGTWGTLAGQPTDDSELALLLARSILREGRYDAAAALDAYVHWLATEPFDVGTTIGRALRAAAAAPPGARRAAAAGAASHESKANGAMMRVAPLAIHGAADPARAADLAREDAALTHPNVVCREASAAFVAATATAIGRGVDTEGAWRAARDEAVRGGEGDVIAALDAARSAPPERLDGAQQGYVLLALQNAFFRLLHAPTFEEGLVATVGEGGDADTNGAIAGALLGAVHGRDAVPSRWVDAVLSCRALAVVGARHPRPPELWAIDALAIAESLVVLGE
jgi:ADP-ribosylglycohydrolase/fructose-1,6-bisphosphatase/inositol monophosphatase family enzyme